MGDLAQGRLDEAAAHLPVAEAHVRTTTPDRRRRLEVAIVSLLAREIGRPYLEVGCLAQLSFADIFHGAATPMVDSFAATQRRCREAIALANGTAGARNR